MTTGPIPPVLKDVVAYVDVWSSDKTANYSKPFVQQLQELGAQVSKTFNKQVTHVVFNNGHQATWRNAQKKDVKLVSVLWVGRCYDDSVHVDEALYPALNDESNPVLKNKKHRCMQPKDSPERTPENDKRMKKKLDKMMKDLISVEPLVTDVSPIIIDEESGIVYSPALKRSNYMAQRLKDMKEKREHLSPTASQMAESCSLVRLKPSLGSTPTVLKLMFDQSDDESSASAAEPGCSPDKEERRTDVNISDGVRVEKASHRKDSEEPWPSTSSSEGMKTMQSPLRCPDKNDGKGMKLKKTRKSAIRKMTEEENRSAQTSQDLEPHNSKNFRKEKRQSQINSASLKPERGQQKIKTNETSTHTTASIPPSNADSSSCVLSVSGVGAELSKEAALSLQNTPKRARTSMSALVRSFTVSSESHRVAPGVMDGDDVFEDYFSPVNRHQRSKKRNLPLEADIQLPFELDPVPKKRKQKRSESAGSETIGQKKRRLEESQHHLCYSSLQEVKPSLEQSTSSTKATVVANRQRQSSLLCTSADTIDSERQRASVQSTVLKGKATSSPDISAQSNTESPDNECSVAAGFADIKSEGDGIDNQQINLYLQKPLNKTKAMRTLVMTSMPSEKQSTVVQVVKSLGGFDIVDCVCESTTHVVSWGHRRTLNILLGIARGCWILSFEWILWCLEQRHWIPEEPFELSDQFPAAQICRLQRHLSAGEHQQDLFQGQPVMYVSQNSQPPTQSLVELIQLCGGSVCKTVRQAGVCIGRYSGRRPEGVRILSEQWILDSITHLKQLSYADYDLEI